MKKGKSVCYQWHLEHALIHAIHLGQYLLLSFVLFIPLPQGHPSSTHRSGEKCTLYFHLPASCLVSNTVGVLYNFFPTTATHFLRHHRDGEECSKQADKLPEIYFLVHLKHLQNVCFTPGPPNSFLLLLLSTEHIKYRLD